MDLLCNGESKTALTEPQRIPKRDKGSPIVKPVLADLFLEQDNQVVHIDSVCTEVTYGQVSQYAD